MNKYNNKDKNTCKTFPKDLKSIWSLAGELNKKTVVTEYDTELALKQIWSSVDTTDERKKPSTIRYLVAAVTIIAAMVGFLNFFTIQKNSLSGEISIIELRDGSKITLMGNSSIEYPFLFGITNRDIKLKGHAHFDVVADDRLPFVVTSHSFETKVLGTIFEIEDWKSTAFTTPNVFVYEGVVEVQDKINALVLHEGDGVSLDNEDQKIINADRYYKNHTINWNTKRVNFKNIPLNNLFERLSLQYNSKIAISDGIDAEQIVSGSYRFNISLEEILIDIVTVKNLSFEKIHNGYIIQ